MGNSKFFIKLKGVYRTVVSITQRSGLGSFVTIVISSSGNIFVTNRKVTCE